MLEICQRHELKRAEPSIVKIRVSDVQNGSSSPVYIGIDAKRFGNLSCSAKMALFQSLLFLIFNGVYLFVAIIANLIGFCSFKPLVASQSDTIQLEALKTAIHKHRPFRADDTGSLDGKPKSDAEKKHDFEFANETRICVAHYISNPPKTFSKNSCCVLSRAGVFWRIPLLVMIMGASALQAGFLEWLGPESSVPKDIEWLSVVLFVAEAMLGTAFILMGIFIIVCVVICMSETDLAWGWRLRRAVNRIRRDCLRNDDGEDAGMVEKGQRSPEEKLRWWVKNLLKVDEDNEEKAEKRMEDTIKPILEQIRC